MAKKTNFEVLAEMAKRNLDIKMSTTFVSANYDKRGGVVGMGVEQKVILDLATGDKHQCILFVVDFDQYKEIAGEK